MLIIYLSFPLCFCVPSSGYHKKASICQYKLIKIDPRKWVLIPVSINIFCLKKCFSHFHIGMSGRCETFIPLVPVIVVQLLSHMWLFATPMDCSMQDTLTFTVFQNLFRFMSIKSVMLSSRLIFCHLLLHLPLILPSIRVFSNESGDPCIGVSSFSISCYEEVLYFFFTLNNVKIMIDPQIKYMSFFPLLM